MKKSVLVLLVIIIAVAGYFIYTSGILNWNYGENGSSKSASYMDVSAQEAKELIDNNPALIVIDVSPHYDKGHLPGAVNYYPSSELDAAIPTLDKDAMYLVYCHVDSASRSGAQRLIDAGFTNVYRLDSHYSGWVDAGYDVEM